MHSIITIIASLSGLGIGYAIASHFATRAKDLLVEQFREEQTKAIASSEQVINTLQTEVNEAKQSTLQLMAKEKEKEKEKAAAQKASQQQIDAAVEMKKKHATEVEKLTKTNKDLAAKLKKMKSTTGEKPATPIKAHSSGISVLRPPSSSGSAENPQLATALKGAGKNLNPILQAIVEHEKQETAVLVDGSGIIIASAGNTETADNISASADILTSVPHQLTGMLPLARHHTFRIQDGSNAVTGRTFELSGDTLALITVGASAPPETSIDSTLHCLHKALE